MLPDFFLTKLLQPEDNGIEETGGIYLPFDEFPIGAAVFHTPVAEEGFVGLHDE